MPKYAPRAQSPYSKAGIRFKPVYTPLRDDSRPYRGTRKSRSANPSLAGNPGTRLDIHYRVRYETPDGKMHTFTSEAIINQLPGDDSSWVLDSLHRLARHEINSRENRRVADWGNYENVEIPFTISGRIVGVRTF